MVVSILASYRTLSFLALVLQWIQCCPPWCAVLRIIELDGSPLAMIVCESSQGGNKPLGQVDSHLYGVTPWQMNVIIVLYICRLISVSIFYM